MKTHIKFMVAAAIVATFSLSTDAQIASNPPFTLEQAVISAGSGTSADSGNIYKIEGTIGQPVAGTNSTNSPFAVRSGFFTPAPFGATAALVKVGGRVTTADGRGIRNVVITLANGNNLPRIARSSSFGYFSFDDVPVGEVYILSVRAKQFQFNSSTQVISVAEEITDISFVAGLQ